MKHKYCTNIDESIHDKGVLLAERKRISFSQYIEELIKSDISKEENILKKHN